MIQNLKESTKKPLKLARDGGITGPKANMYKSIAFLCASHRDSV